MRVDAADPSGTFAPLGPETVSEVVTSGDWTFGVHRQGTGTPVVLLHGLLTDSRVWLPVMAGLRHEHPVVAVDGPGHGLAPARGTPYTLEEEVDRLADAYRALGDGRPTVWVGHSMGGMKALRMALRHPSLVSGLVLVDTQPYAEPESTARPFLAMVETVLSYGMSEDLARMVARLNFHRSFQGSDPARYWIDHFRTLTGERIEQACNSVYTRGDIADLLPGITVPTLVVHGSGDVPIRPPVAARYTTLLPHARLVELPDTGHTPPVERPIELLALIEEFLKAGARAQSSPTSALEDQ
ncbi:alpha/beta fold hydrolase [Streptomyces sp. NBC_00572]|uniref:alpha/beta fold hydrolase n=1 Tax=Streptomyces sp. NBC_00572 TaxID=2903664 RepID=UPI002251B742|nr:alpha/beta hydrolase [Streptomyces sp. NBC_00572]MCX4984944.1 alpha/beta hydrolase [Streptomyces sp. NBC_00572]